jgi:hypothetical protein
VSKIDLITLIKMHISQAAVLAAVGFFATANAQSSTNPVTGILGDSLVVSDNPIGTTYTATLNTKLTGSVVATSQNGTGVTFNVNVHGFPSEGGPFCEFPLPCKELRA